MSLYKEGETMADVQARSDKFEEFLNRPGDCLVVTPEEYDWLQEFIHPEICYGRPVKPVLMLKGRVVVKLPEGK